jgi:hypothetical protein
MKREWVSAFTTAVAAVLILSAPAVYGDQITTFSLATDYSQPVGEALGAVTIDTTTGTVDAIDLSFVGEPSSVLPIGTNSDLFGSGPNQLIEIFEAWDDVANNSYFPSISCCPSIHWRATPAAISALRRTHATTWAASPTALRETSLTRMGNWNLFLSRLACCFLVRAC